VAPAWTAARNGNGVAPSDPERGRRHPGDLTTDYVGSATNVPDPGAATNDPDDTHTALDDLVGDCGLVTWEPSPATSTQAYVMTQERSDELGITKLFRPLLTRHTPADMDDPDSPCLAPSRAAEV
jgi:hypothetical protein